jgi:hypothetical protein
VNLHRVLRRRYKTGIVAIAAAAGAGVILWPHSAESDVPARPASVELANIFSAAPPVPRATLSAVQQRTFSLLQTGEPYTIDQSRIRLAYNHRTQPTFQIYVAPTSDGGVCIVQSFGSAACIASFEDEGRPHGLSATFGPIFKLRRVLVSGLVPDNVSSVDIEVDGVVRHPHQSGNGVWMQLKRHETSSDIGNITYHYDDGQTVSAPFFGVAK